MENYLAKTVFFIDAILFLIAVLLSIFIVVYLAIKRQILKRRQIKLQHLVSNLQKLTVDGKELVMDGCVNLMRKVAGDELFGVVKRQEFSECINISGKAQQIEQAAQSSRNKWQRIEAIIALGYLKTANTVGILKASLSAKDEDVAYFSMLALGRIKSKESAEALLSAIKKRIFSGYKIAAVLEVFPPNIIVGELIRSLKDPDSNLRFWAVKLLTVFKPSQNASEISHLTRDESPNVRAAACASIGDIVQDGAKETAETCLDDSVWFVKIHAVRSLEKILGAAAVPDLINLLNDPSWFVQEAVKSALIKHIEQALPYIENLLESGGPNTKKACLEILDASGYTKRVLDGIISQDSLTKEQALRLLKAMLNAGAHSGLESFLMMYPPQSYSKILEEIARLDKERAEHLDKKIKGQIVEV